MNNIPKAYLLTPEELIFALIRRGWSQERIAIEIETTQATVSRIMSGYHKDPRHSIAVRLRDLVLQLDEFKDLP